MPPGRPPPRAAASARRPRGSRPAGLVGQPSEQSVTLRSMASWVVCRALRPSRRSPCPGHQVEDLPVGVLAIVLAPGQSRGDGGIDREPPAATSRMAWTRSSPWASRSFSRYASPRLPPPRSARAYASSSWAESTTTPVPGWRPRISCAQSMPSSWKFGGILMSVTTTSGDVLVGRGHERRRVLGHADHLDVVGHRQQGADALPDQHVVVAQHDPDRHSRRSSRPVAPCTIRGHGPARGVRRGQLPGSRGYRGPARPGRGRGAGGHGRGPRRAHGRGGGTRARRRAHRHPDAAHQHRPRASRPRRGSGPSIPDIGVVVLSQYAERATPTTC